MHQRHRPGGPPRAFASRGVGRTAPWGWRARTPQIRRAAASSQESCAGSVVARGRIGDARCAGNGRKKLQELPSRQGRKASAVAYQKDSGCDPARRSEASLLEECATHQDQHRPAMSKWSATEASIPEQRSAISPERERKAT